MGIRNLLRLGTLKQRSNPIELGLQGALVWFLIKNH